MKKILLIFLTIFGFIGGIYLGTYLGQSRSTKTQTYSGTINVLNWTSYIPADVISDFEKEYKIKVNYSTYSSNEELLAKISSAAEGTYDLIFPSDYMVALMARRDMLSSLDKSKLKNLNLINPTLLNQPYDPENIYSLPFLLATTVLVYDSATTSPITSYQDLFRSNLKNDLVLLDDQRVVIGAMLNTLGYSVNDTDETHLNESLALFNDLRDNIKAFDSDSPKTFFITNEVDAGLIWSAEAILAKNERPSLEIVYPEEGYIISLDNFCIPKSAKNVDNVYLFIDYLLRDDVAARIVAEYPYISSNLNTGNQADLESIIENGSYIENLNEHTKDYDQLWVKYK